MPTAIENMVEAAKQKLIGVGAAAALPGAAITDFGANIGKAMPKLGLGAVGALTGMNAPKTPEYKLG